MTDPSPGRVDATPPPGVGSASPAAAGTDAVVLTRSEEQMRVGTETVAVSRVRVRKVIVTEERTITVVLRHEELRVDTEPLSPQEEAPVGPGGVHTGEPEPEPDVLELVLHAERPVLTTEVVPVERVRISTHRVKSEEPVTGQVHREVVDLDPPR